MLLGSVHEHMFVRACMGIVECAWDKSTLYMCTSVRIITALPLSRVFNGRAFSFLKPKGSLVASKSYLPEEAMDFKSSSSSIDNEGIIKRMNEQTARKVSTPCIRSSQHTAHKK